jgi:hypothetical protein
MAAFLRRAIGVRRTHRFVVCALCAVYVDSSRPPTRAVGNAVLVYSVATAALAAANAFVATARGGLARAKPNDRAAAARLSSAVLVCGGEACRDELGARLATDAGSSCRLAFFSSGHYKLRADFKPTDYRRRFVGVDWARLSRVMELDVGGALDTLSNFTRFVEYLELRERTQEYLGQERRDHTAVVVITSAYHRRRAAAVAAVVLGSRGISFVMEDAAPMHNGRTEKEHQKHLQALRGAAEHEAWWKRSRDAVRAVLWILCGFTGERIVSIRHPGRIGARRRASGTESRFAALVH